jgi:molybdopterin-guanine dinucleotide biosynthesis protein A
MSPDGAGIDKGWVSFRGRPMVRHVIERLEPQVDRLILNAPPLAHWQALEYPLAPDQFGGFLGPLAGIQAGLGAATTKWVLCVPCDAPLLPPDLAERLSNRQAQTGATCVSVVVGDRAHPVFALVNVGLAAELERYLASGARKVESWFESVGGVSCDFPDQKAFVNLNTTEELRSLEGV